MADKNKATFAYGSLSRLDAAIASNIVDEYDLLLLQDDGVARIGWVDKDKNPVILDIPSDVVKAVDSLPASGEKGVVYIVGNEVHIWDGAKFVKISESTDLSAFEGRVSALETAVSSTEEKVSALETEVAAKADAKQVAEDISQAKAEAVADAVADANAYADKQAAAILDKCLGEKYEIISTPKGTLVDYRDKEIRVMVPAGTQWVKQSVGANGNANMYYMGFKAYAPEGAVSFKEDDLITIEDQTMYYFEGNDFAGTDKYGRKYSIVWLALAVYDEASDTWSYFGEQSSTERYIGWYYSVEWYDADGVVIASDRIRINLSNETCHSEIKPFYMSDFEAEIKKYTDEIIEAKIEEISEIPVVEF